MSFEQLQSFTDHRKETSEQLEKMIRKTNEEIALLEKKATRPILGLSERDQYRLSFLYKEKRRLEEGQKQLGESRETPTVH